MNRQPFRQSVLPSLIAVGLVTAPLACTGRTQEQRLAAPSSVSSQPSPRPRALGDRCERTQNSWISEDVAKKIPLQEDPSNPYIKMTILTSANDNNRKIFKPGVYWLVAFHVSSKDTPNWVWATVEHVNNPGRCDYTGCNDSYGYTTPDGVEPHQAKNYTEPHTTCDDLPIPSYTFDNGKPYPGGAITPQLKELLDGLGIGGGQPTRCAPQLGGHPPRCTPSPADSGWRSYRLKGSQVNFTDSMGQPTRLGNSVTEGRTGAVSSRPSPAAPRARVADGPPGVGPRRHSRGSMGSLSSASTPNTHSCTR
ncbi:hypothetical protein [Sorangium sp. So ce131]|uniref:hypothetical protein n=1 Tax=Sorangium sp. So ce131 TaxID=3133282 RepID=UPI003F6051CC